MKNKVFNHPILKKLGLNFVGMDGKAVDTVIFAGENDCGKSTIIDELYKIVTGREYVSSSTEYEIDGEIYAVHIKRRGLSAYAIEYFDRNGNGIEEHRHNFCYFRTWISTFTLRIFLLLQA